MKTNNIPSFTMANIGAANPLKRKDMDTPPPSTNSAEEDKASLIKPRLHHLPQGTSDPIPVLLALDLLPVLLACSPRLDAESSGRGGAQPRRAKETDTACVDWLPHAHAVPCCTTPRPCLGRRAVPWVVQAVLDRLMAKSLEASAYKDVDGNWIDDIADLAWSVQPNNPTHHPRPPLSYPLAAGPTDPTLSGTCALCLPPATTRVRRAFRGGHKASAPRLWLTPFLFLFFV